MFKTILIFLNVILLLQISASQNTTQSDLTDLFIWKEIDELCEILENIEKQNVSRPNVTDIRIIEYTTYSYQFYNLSPSAVTSLMNSKYFDAERQTIIFVHGFMSDPLNAPAKEMFDGIKRYNGYNVITLDSTKLIKSLYIKSVSLIKYIGEYLGHFLYDLTVNGVNVNKLHVIGHSLGAHIAGFAGKTFNTLCPSNKLPWITGLDPAGPCFYNVDPSERLNSTDAKFVDIIHTNIGIYGLNKSIGHADFYPNGGGFWQPGCLKSTTCSHRRAYEFYTESIRYPEHFLSVKCNNWDSFLNNECVNNQRARMGFTVNHTIRGDFYLKTKDFPQYGLSDEGIQ